MLPSQEGFRPSLLELLGDGAESPSAKPLCVPGNDSLLCCIVANATVRHGPVLPRPPRIGAVFVKFGFVG